jgi:uncharacterized membrane protein YphA (DoxX/SURF4 family)
MIPTIIRIVAGLAWTVFGLNGFLDFLPHPTTPPPEGAMAFGGALFQTGYMIPLIKGTELFAGVLLLSGRFAPLGVVVLAPVLVNIVAFHAFLAPGDLLIPLILLAFELYLAWTYRRAYRGLVVARPAELW